MARRANLHPSPLSGWSEDCPDDEDVFMGEDDFDEPDAICGDCGEGVYAEDKGLTEGFERFGALLCEACFNERCEEEADEPDPDRLREDRDERRRLAAEDDR